MAQAEDCHPALLAKAIKSVEEQTPVRKRDFVADVEACEPIASPTARKITLTYILMTCALTSVECIDDQGPVIVYFYANHLNCLEDVREGANNREMRRWRDAVRIDETRQTGFTRAHDEHWFRRGATHA